MKGYLVVIESLDEAHHGVFFCELEDAKSFARASKNALTTGWPLSIVIWKAGAVLPRPGRPPRVYINGLVNYAVDQPVNDRLWGQFRFIDGKARSNAEEKERRIEADNRYNHFQVWSAARLQVADRRRSTKALVEMQNRGLIGQPLGDMWKARDYILGAIELEKEWEKAYLRR